MRLESSHGIMQWKRVVDLTRKRAYIADNGQREGTDFSHLTFINSKEASTQATLYDSQLLSSNPSTKFNEHLLRRYRKNQGKVEELSTTLTLSNRVLYNHSQDSLRKEQSDCARKEDLLSRERLIGDNKEYFDFTKSSPSSLDLGSEKRAYCVQPYRESASLM